uniref:mRNA cap guanine-N7 methyltransferase n=1 Tax=Rhabditophanes sp. KR3021 TaxID=114890 RepID=A0AC35U015_9BILA
MTEQNSVSVSKHYNSVKEVGIDIRKESVIYHLRNFNNFIKSSVIQEFVSKLKEESFEGKFLDLCCGKGGDLKKWKMAGAKSVVMTDIAEVSLTQCVQRYQETEGKNRNPRYPTFEISVIHADSSLVRLNDFIPEEKKPFDLASCQFALHYAFETEAKARQMIQNATENLKEGGYFVGTIPNANLILSLLRKEKKLFFENKVCKVTYLGEETNMKSEEENLKDLMETNIPLFGSKIDWRLDDVVNCPEYLVHIPLLTKLMEECGMELVYCKRFDDALTYYSEVSGESKHLMERIKVWEKYPCRSHEKQLHDDEEYEGAKAEYDKADNRRFFGTMGKCEWEIVSMYMVFAYRKKAGKTEN